MISLVDVLAVGMSVQLLRAYFLIFHFCQRFFAGELRKLGRLIVENHVIIGQLLMLRHLQRR